MWHKLIITRLHVQKVHQKVILVLEFRGRGLDLYTPVVTHREIYKYEQKSLIYFFIGKKLSLPTLLHLYTLVINIIIINVIFHFLGMPT